MKKKINLFFVANRFPLFNGPHLLLIKFFVFDFDIKDLFIPEFQWGETYVHIYTRIFRNIVEKRLIKNGTLLIFMLMVRFYSY